MAQNALPEYLLPFLDYCEIEKGLSNNTQRNYRQYLKVFVHWLKQSGKATLRPHQLTADHIWDYRLYLARTYKMPRGGTLTKKSQNFYLIALRALLDFFAERDIEALPSSKVKLAKQPKYDHIAVLALHEVERMLELPDTTKLDGLRDRAIMETFFSSGMRVAELVSLDVDHVGALLQRQPERALELSILGKGQRVRTVFISVRAAGWIRAYLEARGDDELKALFTNLRSNEPQSRRLSPRAMQLIFRNTPEPRGSRRK